jgi:hypothetical protein
MNDYEELSDEEYAAEITWAHRNPISQADVRTMFHSLLKARRRKPKPIRITGWMGVSPSLHDTTCVYPRKEDVPKQEGWVVIYIDQEVPE